MTKPIRIMIDMETTAQGARAGILTLGACTFGLESNLLRQTFYMRASLASNEALKRTIDKSTMEWWNKQDPSIREEAFGGTDSVDDVLDGFAKWCDNLSNSNPGDIELWSRGASFDCEILQDAFYQIFGAYPFDFRKHMCQRTLQRLMPTELIATVPQRVAKHISYIDAYNQADIADAGLRSLQWQWKGARGNFRLDSGMTGLD